MRMVRHGIDHVLIHVVSLVFSVLCSGHVHTNTLYWHARPYGCSVIVATYDEDSGPQLYAIEPSGVCYVSRRAQITRGRASMLFCCSSGDLAQHRLCCFVCLCR
jgi:hypothetical protein